MIRVMLVDDQKLVRECIESQLQSDPDIEVVAQAESGEVARLRAREGDVDVVLMDLQMPGIGRLEATKRLLQIQPEIKVIGLSMYVEGPLPQKLLELGGVGYVSKDESAENLITAVKRAYAGQTFISSSVAHDIITSDLDKLRERFSWREIQVWKMLSDGIELDEIATSLNRSPKTVGYYRRQLLGKLQAKNDVQLANLARDYGLTP